MKNEKRFQWLCFPAAFIILLLLAVLGAILQIPVGTAQTIGGVLTAVLVLWYAANFLYIIRQSKDCPDRKDLLDKVRSLRDGGDEALSMLRKKLDHAFALSRLIEMLLILWVIAIGLVLHAQPGLAIFPIFVLGRLIYRYLPLKKRKEVPSLASDGEFQPLYALAEDAQRAVGGSRSIRISLDIGCYAAIYLSHGEAHLMLGAIMLNYLSRDEVYQIMLHEFAHLQDDRQLRYERRHSRLNSSDPLFAMTDGYVERTYAYYGLFASRKQEEKADRAILEHGDAEIAANAFAKLSCQDNYTKDILRSGVRMLAYEPETPSRDRATFVLNDLQAAIAKNESLAQELIFKELRPKMSSHPIYRDRIETLGISKIDLAAPIHEREWAIVCGSALAWADQSVFEHLSENYDQAREEHYLKPLRNIDTWIEEGQPLSYEATRDVLEAMYVLERYESILGLSESFAASGAPEIQRCHAIFYEGLARLRLGDASGLDILHRAAQLNNNYVESGFDAIATYCAALGLEEEMERFRQIFHEMEDGYMEYLDVLPLTAHDHLERADLAPDLWEENLQVIQNVGGDQLSAVYLVKKMLSAGNGYYIYILKLHEDTSDELQAQIYDQVFMHLDKQEEQYFLTVWEKELKWLDSHTEFQIL